MRIDPAIAELRSDRALQHHVQCQLERAGSDWLDSPMTSDVTGEIERYASGIPIDRLPRLAGLIGNADLANRFVQEWCAAMVRALQQQPLGQVPFRYNCSAGFTAIRLAASGGVSLSLLAYEERLDARRPVSAIFADRELHEMVLAGSASGMFHRIAAGAASSIPPLTSEFQWKAGDRIVTRGHDEARQMLHVKGRLSILQLARERPHPAPTREVSLENGRVLQLSNGDKRESQIEMALAVLGAMHRNDAAPAIAQLADSGSDHLRWQAIRHTIALDTGRGWQLLEQISRSPRDKLNVPARELQAKLASAYPQLLEQEPETCPA